MRNRIATTNQKTRRILPIAGITAIAVALTAALPRAHDDRPVPPPVPDNIQVPAGNKVFAQGRAYGTQDYVCLPATTGVAWSGRPQATLFDDDDRQVMTHFLSPNPSENGLARPTWQSSRDTSAVWGELLFSSSDPNFVAPGAIPWLLLRIVGADEGPTGGDKLTRATYIHRLNTAGGRAPSTGCAGPADLGNKVYVPYVADYFFYREAGHGHVND